MEQIFLNGVGVYPFTSMDEMLDYIDAKKGILVAVNSGKIYKATDQTRKIINSGIGYVDGIGAKYALKKKGVPNAVRIPGCELWLEIIKRTYQHDKSYYFVGGKQEVIDKTIHQLEDDFPGIHIAGYRNGYMNSQEEQALIDDIAQKQPDYVFVAMGSPKQELLMQKMAERNDAVYQGLGGSFDVYIGNVKRAPKWYIDHGLEGPYRVVSDMSWARLRRFREDFTFLVKVFFNRY